MYLIQLQSAWLHTTLSNRHHYDNEEGDFLVLPFYFMAV